MMANVRVSNPLADVSIMALLRCNTTYRRRGAPLRDSGAPAAVAARALE